MESLGGGSSSLSVVMVETVRLKAAIGCRAAILALAERLHRLESSGGPTRGGGMMGSPSSSRNRSSGTATVQQTFVTDGKDDGR